MNYRYKDKTGVWLSRPEQWQIDAWKAKGNPGEPVLVVDCISLGSGMAWAFDDYDVLEVNADLLRQKIRWPRELTPVGKMRSIKSLTRDPYLNHWFACVKLDRLQFLETTPLPWWLRRRYAVSWYKFILTENPYYKDVFEKNLRRLLWWGKHTEGLRLKVIKSRFKLIKQLHHRFGINMYSLKKWCQMSHAIKSWDAKMRLLPFMPDQNLYFWLLAHPEYVSQEEIDNFIPQRRNIWSSHEFYQDKPLEDGDEYPLDKQLLIKLKG